MQQPEFPAETVLPADEPSPKRLVNPGLSVSLAADHAALQNDLLQAQDLAADFQRQLAGKSNEYAQLKQILEKTEKDLAHFQEGIVELRAERHRLANEAMRAVAFQAKLTKVTSERDRLRIELEVIRHALEQKGEDMIMQLRDRDRRVAELVVEMVVMKQELEEAQNTARLLAGVQTVSAPQEQLPKVRLESELEPEVEIVRSFVR